jgi:hypothetical protein
MGMPYSEGLERGSSMDKYHRTADGAEPGGERAAKGSPRRPRPTISFAQAASYADQGLSNRDQAFSSADQAQSDRDMASAVSDQRASDDDQAIADRLHADQPHPTDAEEAVYVTSRAARDEASRARQLSGYRRSTTSFQRDAVANERDQGSTERDGESAGRNEGSDDASDSGHR